MSQNKLQALANNIISNLGGLQNINTLENCMTRVRITIHQDNKINLDDIKKIAGVMGVVLVSGQYQIIVGPGNASTVKNLILNEMSKYENNDLISTTKKEMKQKYEVSFNKFLKQIADIFIPLIPALIGAGFLLGLSNILKNPTISGSLYQNYPDYINLLAVFGGAIFSVLTIAVGITSAKVFGGSLAVGATMAAILVSPALANISLFGGALVPARGGIISVILVVWMASFIENKLKSVITGALDLVLVPLLTILSSGIIAILIVQPIGGYIANGIAYISLLGLQHGGAFAGFLLAGLFLPVVMTGLHQALIPIHFQLIQEIGSTPLFPILAMAGAGQVGASFAVLLKTTNVRLKKILHSSLPVGVLGIGEPLIYGVTLPLGKPFITACLGGAMGGAVIAFFKVGAVSVGISGLPLLVAVTPGFALYYLYGILTAYLFGFLFTFFVKFDDSKI